MLRTGNKGLAAATLLLDGAKGAVAVLIAAWLGGHDAVRLGRHRRGAWPRLPGLARLPGRQGGRHFLRRADRRRLAGRDLRRSRSGWSMAALSRMSSLAALASFALAPVLAAFLADATVVKLALAIAVLVFARHHTNIRRLIAGTEPRIGQKA